MFLKSCTRRHAVVATAALLLCATASPAQYYQVRPAGTQFSNSGDRVWNYSGYQGYRESASAQRLIDPSAMAVAPVKYQLYTQALPMPSGDRNVALVMAHVPENAEVFFEGTPTNSKGDTRHFRSVPLTPGYQYSYTVRVDWVEEGKKVTQTHDLIVKPGESACFYLIEAGKGLEPPHSVIEASLAKLSPADRKLAEAQKFCAVQTGVPLGATGTPVKIDVKGQPVFLCCAACEARARANAEATLGTVRSLVAKTSAK